MIGFALLLVIKTYTFYVFLQKFPELFLNFVCFLSGSNRIGITDVNVLKIVT